MYLKSYVNETNPLFLLLIKKTQLIFFPTYLLAGPATFLKIL